MVFGDPRKAGKAVSVDDARGMETNAPAEGDANLRTVRSYDVSVIPLVIMEDDSIVSPACIVDHPRYTDDGVVVKKRLNYVRVVLDNRDHTKIPLAVGDEIEIYVFLFKSLDEDTGWRVLQFSRDDIPGDRLVVADLLDLPRLSDHPQGEAFWRAFQRAQSEDERLRQ